MFAATSTTRPKPPPTTESAWDTLSTQYNLAAIGKTCLSENSPIWELYQQSLIRSQTGHFEGFNIIPGICTLIEGFKASYSRVEDAEMVRRISDVFTFTRALFASLGDFAPPSEYSSGTVEGVVWYGSSLRGKIDPSDIDIRIVTSYATPMPCDFDHAVMNPLDNAVNDHLLTHFNNPLTIAGINAEVIINSSFKDVCGTDLVDLFRGPYLIIMKDPSCSYEPGSTCSFRAFFNASGTTYLRDRKP